MSGFQSKRQMANSRFDRDTTVAVRTVVGILFMFIVFGFVWAIV
jgi:hypothetical protein